MVPKLRHRLPKEPGWVHPQPYQVARRVQGHEAGRPGKVRMHPLSKLSKRTGILSSPWTTIHYHSTSQSTAPSTSMSSARKRQVQVRRCLPIYCGKVCTLSSSRRSQVLLEVVMRPPSRHKESLSDPVIFFASGGCTARQDFTPASCPT